MFHTKVMPQILYKKDLLFILYKINISKDNCNHNFIKFIFEVLYQSFYLLLGRQNVLIESAFVAL